VLVDAAPGTTRDPVEVELTDGLSRWTVVDTAGLRPDATGLEGAGIRLSRAAMQSSDLVVWLLDPLHPAWPPDDLGVDLFLGGKADLADAGRRADVEALAAARGAQITAWVSGQRASDAAALRRQLGDLMDPQIDDAQVVVMRQRHVDALRRGADALGRLDEALTAGHTLDVLSIELEEAATALATILGRNVDADILERIFSEFCIGK
jgi:tRNA modification GTPase